MSLVNEITKHLLPEEKKREIAVYGGGFKPPTDGHFEVVKTAMKKNPNIDKFIILIGGKERDGVTSADSILIWDIYKKYLPIKTEIKLSTKPPIQAVYNYAKEHPEELVLFVIGAREGNEDDFKDITIRTKSVNNYPNLKVETVITQAGASGTAARNASKISFDKFKSFLPKELTEEEKEEVYNILTGKVTEIIKEVLNPKTFDFSSKIKSLTKSMEEDGLKLKPYPKIRFIHDEEFNADNFFGKTAYYEPNTNEVVLYTLGRHPKDIMRSYAHELIHVHQNHENRLNNINTTDVNEDDYLEKIEREAYENGNIMFRSWTNKITEEQSIFKNQNLQEFSLSPDIKSIVDKFLGGVEKAGKKLLAIAKREGKQTLALIKEIAEWVIKGEKPTPAEQNKINKQLLDLGFLASLGLSGISNAFGIIYWIIQESDVVKEFFKLDEGKNMDLMIYNDGEGSSASINKHPKFGYIATISGEYDYQITNKSLAGLVVKLKKDGFKKQIYEGENKDPFGLNAYALQLAKGLEEQESDYKVYLDMDGVVANFDKRFEDLSGMKPNDFEEKYGKNKFWDFIDEDHKVSFWVGIPVMDGAKKLVDYVKKYNYELLTAPSVKKQSYLGKILWVRNHSDLLGGKPRINFKKAKAKHEVKDKLTKFDIIIDDRADTVGRWKAKGGTGIVFKSPDQVINDLKKIGL